MVSGRAPDQRTPTIETGLAVCTVLVSAPAGTASASRVVFDVACTAAGAATAGAAGLTGTDGAALAATVTDTPAPPAAAQTSASPTRRTTDRRIRLPLQLWKAQPTVALIGTRQRATQAASPA